MMKKTLLFLMGSCLTFVMQAGLNNNFNTQQQLTLCVTLCHQVQSNLAASFLAGVIKRYKKSCDASTLINNGKRALSPFAITQIDEMEEKKDLKRVCKEEMPAP